MKQTRTRLFVTMALSSIAVLAVAASHDATAAEPFGPIESRSFLAKPGTSIELPAGSCNWNSDYLFIKGPNVAAAKQVDVGPDVWTRYTKNGGVPTSDCVAPNCVQLFVSVDKKPAAGTKTVTLKHPDGRTLTTTFDVVPNAGRCDKR